MSETIADLKRSKQEKKEGANEISTHKIISAKMKAFDSACIK